MLDGLEGDTADTSLGEGEVHDLAEFVVVETLFQGADEGGGEVEGVEAVEGAAADIEEIGAAERADGIGAEGVELEVDLKAGRIVGEALGEVGVLRDAEAVGVEHQVLDRAALRGVEDGEEIGVERRLAAGDLHDVGLALVTDDGVEHELDLRERAVGGALGRGLGVADGAGEIAGVGDLEERKAGVLLVVGAEAAVIGAAVLDGGVELAG